MPTTLKPRAVKTIWQCGVCQKKISDQMYISYHSGHACGQCGSPVMESYQMKAEAVFSPLLGFDRFTVGKDGDFTSIVIKVKDQNFVTTFQRREKVSSVVTKLRGLADSIESKSVVNIDKHHKRNADCKIGFDFIAVNLEKLSYVKSVEYIYSHSDKTVEFFIKIKLVSHTINFMMVPKIIKEGLPAGIISIGKDCLSDTSDYRVRYTLINGASK